MSCRNHTKKNMDRSALQWKYRGLTDRILPQIIGVYLHKDLKGILLRIARNLYKIEILKEEREAGGWSWDVFVSQA